jgi:hypothetical protein
MKNFGKLLTDGMANAKIAKGEGGEYLSTIMHLAPEKQAGIGNVCPFASPGCIAACLNTAGRGRFDATQNARNNRTIYYYKHRQDFMALLVKELTAFVRKADKLSKQACIRLNGTSDIAWEVKHPELFSTFSDAIFYDYTKDPSRCMKSYALPSNYHLTFSRSEVNDKDCKRVLRSGRCNVAVVFSSKNYPSLYWNRPVYSMDETDLRFLDPAGGHVGALYAKGKGKADPTGFVLSTELVKLS